jgi:hypothetical protein
MKIFIWGQALKLYYSVRYYNGLQLNQTSIDRTRNCISYPDEFLP